jgi:DNA-binding GntR family transcriptional regulator
VTRQPSQPAAPNGGLIADRAYVALRDRIVTLALPPGVPLREDALMTELGTGRTPLREAVKRLALEGLVEVRPRSGTYVTDVQAADIVHIAEVRAELEAQAARLAATRLEDGTREAAGRLIEALDAAGALGPDAFMRLDERVHRLVWQAAANPYLDELLERFWALSLRIWYLVLDRLPELPAAVHEQRALLDAVMDRNAERAEALMRAHVQRFEEHLLAAFGR